MFCLFCPRGDRNIPKYAFQYAFRLSNRTRKKEKEENKREESSVIKTALIHGWSPISCFQPSPTGFNLSCIRDSRASQKSNLSATPSFARSWETRISRSINNLILNVMISQPMKTYSQERHIFSVLLRRLFICINLRTRLARSSIPNETSSTFAFFIFAERI